MLKRKKEKFNLRKQKGWLAGSSATQTICVSFLLVIAAGTLLLSLPIASKQGRLGLVDALFTAIVQELAGYPLNGRPSAVTMLELLYNGVARYDDLSILK